MGSPPQAVTGTHAMVDGSIFFDEGQRMNVMTCIGKTLPPESLPELSAFSARAIPIMHLHANTPMRLMLRNHALDDPLDVRQ